MVVILVDTWAYSTLYPGGIPRLMTGTSPPSCTLLENRLYMLSNHHEKIFKKANDFLQYPSKFGQPNIIHF